MFDDDDAPAWKPALDAITGARHGGRITGILDQLKALDAEYPNVAEIAHQLAWTLESEGRETEARPHYERAISLGLPPNEQSGALIGLANCLRSSGEIDAAARTLESGQHQFPDLPEFDAHLALVRHDQGRHAEALQLALGVLLDTSDDPGINAHQRNLRHAVSRLTA